jgi:hypothetical protein
MRPCSRRGCRRCWGACRRGEGGAVGAVGGGRAGRAPRVVRGGGRRGGGAEGRVERCASDGPPPGCSRPKPASAKSRPTVASPPSRSRSKPTSTAGVKLSLTRPRRTSQLSLCNHDTRTAATVNFHDERDNLQPARVTAPIGRPFWELRYRPALAMPFKAAAPARRRLVAAPGRLQQRRR